MSNKEDEAKKAKEIEDAKKAEKELAEKLASLRTNAELIQFNEVKIKKDKDKK